MRWLWIWASFGIQTSSLSHQVEGRRIWMNSPLQQVNPHFCGTSKWITNNDTFCVFFEWKLAGSELLCNNTNALSKNIITAAPCSLNESGLPFISDNNHELAFIHGLIQTGIQCNKTKHHHILKTFLLTTMMRWKDQIKYDIDALFILHSCKYTAAVDDRKYLIIIVVIHLFTIVYWWYFTKYCLVSNCHTGWTHLCSAHHDHQAECIMKSSCFHCTTLNVKWYYMQAMCWWIPILYPLPHTPNVCMHYTYVLKWMQ